MATSIGPGPESVSIQLFAVGPTSARWDRATWDGGTWGTETWIDVDCNVMEATYGYGVVSEAGVLSTPESGPMDLATFDPKRTMDPGNTEGPYFGSLAPGMAIRLTAGVPPVTPVWTGWADELAYDVASAQGRIRAVDGIAYLAQSAVPAGTVLPNTLRARTRAVVAAAGLGPYVPVAPEVPDIDPDPAVAPYDSSSAQPAWQVIQAAAADSLVLVWMDNTGTLRFTSWGGFPDATFSIGCAPAGDTDHWVPGIATIGFGQAAAAIRNAVVAQASAGVDAAAVTDGVSIGRYGVRSYQVPRVVPDRVNWAGKILLDRADASLQVSTGEVRPYSLADLSALLGLGSIGPQAVRVRDDEHPPLIDLTVAAIGATVRVTPVGWSWKLVTMIPRAEWDNTEPEPPIPPIPPPDPWHTETRTYAATSDALLALTSGGAKYGAGAASSLPVGAWSGWTYRSCIKFASIPWTKVRAVTAARLYLRTSSQDRVGFGSSPTIEVRRITQNWSAGSSSSPSGSNSVVYPGPGTTSTGAVRPNITTAQQALASVGITTIARAWAPAAAGGSGGAQYGLMLLPGSGSTADTTEFMPEEAGSTKRAYLELDLQVFD